jgi:hypothetical protein
MRYYDVFMHFEGHLWVSFASSRLFRFLRYRSQLQEVYRSQLQEAHLQQMLQVEQAHQQLVTNLQTTLDSRIRRQQEVMQDQIAIQFKTMQMALDANEQSLLQRYEQARSKDGGSPKELEDLERERNEMRESMLRLGMNRAIQNDSDSMKLKFKVSKDK